MINAQITNFVLGMTEDNVPFTQLEVQYIGEDSKPVRAATDRIFLVSPQTETLANSAMAQAYVTLLMIANSPTWNELTGKVIRVEVSEDGKITKLQNALTDLYVDIGTVEPAEPVETPESTEAPAIDKIEVVDAE